MYGLLTVIVFVLAGVVTGQQPDYVQPGYNPCNQEAMSAGIRVRPHPEFCDLFIQCSSGNKAVVKACPSGTLFDTKASVCNFPGMAICNNNPREFEGKCTSGQFQTKCCNEYISCQDGKKKIIKCSPNSQNCPNVGNGCQDHDLCPTRARPPQTYQATCMKTAVSDKCRYDEYLADGKTVVHRICGAGSAYNATACDCSTKDDTCKPQAYLVNRIMDPACRPSFVLDLQQMPVSYTEKAGQGRQRNPHNITTTGYTSNGNTGMFKAGLNGEMAGLQVPYFAQNMIKSPFGIRITFQADVNNLRQRIVLVGNGADAVKECDSTFEVSASYSQGQWGIEVKAVGDTLATLSGRVQVYNGDTSDVTVVIVYDSKTIRGYASSSSGQVDLGSAEVGGEIKNTACDLKIAYGLVGTLKEFVIREACGDANQLNNL